MKKSDNIHMLIQLIKMLALLGDGFLQLAEPIRSTGQPVSQPHKSMYLLHMQHQDLLDTYAHGRDR